MTIVTTRELRWEDISLLIAAKYCELDAIRVCCSCTMTTDLGRWTERRRSGSLANALLRAPNGRPHDQAGLSCVCCVGRARLVIEDDWDEDRWWVVLDDVGDVAGRRFISVPQ